jgi:Cd2+/Zn2+-exporting ATPase
MLPVVGQASREPEVTEQEAARDEADGCADGCCSDVAAEAPTVVAPTTREANPEGSGGGSLGVLERTVVRVEGMDCASCAATVEKRVSALPGVSKATVNFAAGRLDAEHDPGLPLEDLEGAVRSAGYGVAKTEGAERAPFWRTPRALLTVASALLFLAGLALSIAGAPGAVRAGVYLAAIAVGGLPIFRAAVAGLRARHLDMNVLMSAAPSAPLGSGSGRRPPPSWSCSPPATPCRSTP